MGKCFATGRRGRYEEKGRGNQVGSFFESSTDNEKIKTTYGNYNFWSWLRYWWIDTENQVQLMLIDKGYYDYDYEEPKAKSNIKLKTKSKSELNSMLARFGFNTKLHTKETKPITPDELQKMVMEDTKVRAVK